MPNLQGMNSATHSIVRLCVGINMVASRELCLNKTCSLGNNRSLQSLPLMRSRISLAARFVPSPPAQPLLLNQFTSLGVTAAVSPTLIGKKRVLCTVYAKIKTA